MACSLGSIAIAAAGVLPLEGRDDGSTVAALELRSSGVATAFWNDLDWADGGVLWLAHWGV